jgi:hypothetical protein
MTAVRAGSSSSSPRSPSAPSACLCGRRRHHEHPQDLSATCAAASAGRSRHSATATAGRSTSPAATAGSRVERADATDVRPGGEIKEAKDRALEGHRWRFRREVSDLNSRSSDGLRPDDQVWSASVVGPMHGIAGFFGAGPPVDGLEWIWFTSSALTPRGVGIGSTRATVTRAYGRRLHHDLGNGLYVAGRPVPYAGGARVKPVIYLLFGQHGRVFAVGYGARQQILGTEDVPTVSC